MHDEPRSRPKRNQLGIDGDREPDLEEYLPEMRANLAALREIAERFCEQMPPRRELPQSLRQALHRVDLAFADARLSERFDACPHCFTDADIAYARTVPPAEMSERDIAKIVFDLESLLGSADDIAYFAPAMVRAHVSQTLVEDALVMRHLGRIPAVHWTPERRDALRAVYEAYFAWIPVDEECPIDLTDPNYRTWIRRMLDRPPHGEPFTEPIPGWDAPR